MFAYGKAGCWNVSERFLIAMFYIILNFTYTPQVLAGIFSFNTAPPGDQLMKLTSSGQSLSEVEAKKILATQLRSLADHLSLNASERPFEQLLPRTKIEFFKSNVNGQNLSENFQDRILVVNGDVHLPYAVGVIVIARGNVLIDHGERNTIVSGRNIEISFDGKHNERVSPVSLIVASGWVELSWAASSRIYSSSSIKLDNAREVKLFTPKGVEVSTGGTPAPFDESKIKPVNVKPLFTTQELDRVANTKSEQPGTVTRNSGGSANAKSIISDRAADFRADGTALHAITVSEGNFREVRVDITANARPMTLVLNSHKAVNWILSRQPNVQIKRVIVLCPCQPTVTGLGAGVPVIIGDPRKISSISNEGGNRDDYLEMQEKFETLTGQQPVTFQSGHRGSFFTVDGIKNLPLPPPPTSSGSKGKVVLLSSQGGLLENGSVYTYCCSGANSTARASRSYSSGKWYAEARLLIREKQVNPDTGTNLGLLSASSIDSRFYMVGGTYGHNYPVISSSQHKLFSNGDFIGIAIDLDKGELSYHVDGEWITGLPGSGKAIVLKSGRDYVLGVSVAASSSMVPKDVYTRFHKNQVGQEQLKEWAQYHDRWYVNFGEKPFKFPMPKGFKAYGSNM